MIIDDLVRADYLFFGLLCDGVDILRQLVIIIDSLVRADYDGVHDSICTDSNPFGGAAYLCKESVNIEALQRTRSFGHCDGSSVRVRTFILSRDLRKVPGFSLSIKSGRMRRRVFCSSLIIP
jgi:hypothetical protein